MGIIMISPAVTGYHKANRYDTIFTGSEALLTKKLHVENVINFVIQLYQTLSPDCNLDKNMLQLCAEHHDDGRVDQYRLLGKFWDTEVSHNCLGVERFDKWLQKHAAPITIDTSIKILRNVMMYHGKTDLCPRDETFAYVDLVTTADDLENAASCISYLVREVANDEKGFIQANPNTDQCLVSDFVFEKFAAGEKFDKTKHCHTYGEYILFAATLMTSCLKKYNLAHEILLSPGYGYSSILEGYKHVFEQTLHPEMSKSAYDILKKYAY